MDELDSLLRQAREQEFGLRPRKGRDQSPAGSCDRHDLDCVGSDLGGFRSETLAFDTQCRQAYSGPYTKFTSRVQPRLFKHCLKCFKQCRNLCIHWAVAG